MIRQELPQFSKVNYIESAPRENSTICGKNSEQEVNPSQIGIGHTRWATHGKPVESNAHPHTDNSQRVAVVQNGIIENFQALRTELKEKGCIFDSETDTEVIPHLIASYLPKPTDEEYLGVSPFLKAVLTAIERLEGAFALGVISSDYPDELIVVRQHAPLIIGFGQGEFFCASDVSALVPHTRAVLSLDNGEIARLTPLGVEIYNFEGKRVRKSPRVLDWSPTTVEKQGYRHFMLKEIYGTTRSGARLFRDLSTTPLDSTKWG
jgi:glucosamine--fructose-6-phosphate aminotransferase (isomerizing)